MEGYIDLNINTILNSIEMKNQLGIEKIGKFRHHNDKLLRDKSQENLKTIQKMGQFSSTSLKQQLQEE